MYMWFRDRENRQASWKLGRGEIPIDLKDNARKIDAVQRLYYVDQFQLYRP